MAVFVAAADESAGATTPYFYWGGFLGPESQWSQSFAPAWEANVLNAKPPISVLHQKDIRSGHWRAKHGLSANDAQTKLDEAWKIVNASSWLYPIAVRVDKVHFHATLKSAKVKSRPGVVPYKMEPDYICFLLFAQIAVVRAAQFHPDCEKVDFIVERNQTVTSHIQEFHDTLKQGFIDTGKSEYASLIGDFIPAGKERVPLQAADLLAWYENRLGSTGLDERDIARYKPFWQRTGFRYPVSKEEIDGLRERMETRFGGGEVSS